MISGEHTIIPIFGICLGHQLLALAIGADTNKMKYGNRSQNIPVRLMNTERGFITTQNHGYQVDTTTLPSNWSPLFTNLNDQSNEGIYNETLPFFSVQFHPEGNAGPLDTIFLFDIFHQLVSNKYTSVDWNNLLSPYIMNKQKNKTYKRVLVLGSGGLTIGQAGEFDYSGSQALKSYREEGMYTILVNPNIATVQTTTGINLADKIYSVPVTPEYIRQIIQEEQPDCIAISFGGQTALNCAVKLYKQGDLQDVDILGTNIEMVIKSEDRAEFKQHINQINLYTAPSICTSSLEEAKLFAEEVKYPVLVRNGFALGGLGSGFADNKDELEQLVNKNSIIDKSLRGWREVEYEIVRDKYGNCITVCNMENLDPVGVHTGESIVIAPSQTLNNHEYFLLRDVAIKVANAFQIVGECNIQYALHPTTAEFYIIEINARLSRSSALASKATGYPLAYIAAKLSLGYSLLELKNCITRDTSALYEPSLDYCVIKVPRWDLNKFDHADTTIGTAMKSVGEIMAIGTTLQEALMKGIRMVGQNQLMIDHLTEDKHYNVEDINIPSITRVIKLINYLIYNQDSDHLIKLHPWFINRIKEISAATKIDDQQDILTLKKLGFSDQQVAAIWKTTSNQIHQQRKDSGILPIIKRIDTVAGEFPCDTNYLYTTYNGSNSDNINIPKNTVLVIGSGVYRIGSSVEFDWCSVNAVNTCKELGYGTMMLNYNPETVSTDYDVVDSLLFEEISSEVVIDLWETGLVSGVIVSVGGQESNNIANIIASNGVKILGTDARMIDTAENRFKFSRMLSDINVDQPEWKELTNIEDALKFCNQVSYPCLIRPSYVLSGAGMNVAFSDEELVDYLNNANSVSGDYPVVISKFIIDAKEIEVDAVAQNGELVTMAISEHVENAGVHSGDASLVCPPQDLTITTINRITSSVKKIAAALNINGPFNMQFIAKNDQINY